MHPFVTFRITRHRSPDVEQQTLTGALRRENAYVTISDGLQ
jgi:hypothetical protein